MVASRTGKSEQRDYSNHRYQQVRIGVIFLKLRNSCQERLNDFWVMLYDSAPDTSLQTVLNCAKWKEHRQEFEQRSSYQVPNISAR